MYIIFRKSNKRILAIVRRVRSVHADPPVLVALMCYLCEGFDTLYRQECSQGHEEVDDSRLS